MKKSKIGYMVPFLLMTASTCSLAQSQVTIYGVMDTHVEYLNNVRNADGGKSNLLRMNNSGLQGPRIGFRGTEDLGKGLKAIFTIEHGFNSDNGTQADGTRFFNRGSFLGLENANHRLTLGRQYTSLFDGLLMTTPMAYSGTYEPFSPLLGGLRNDNSIKYRFTKDGWLAQVHYALGEQVGSSSGNAAWGGFVSYVKNGVHATLAVDQQNGAEINGSHSRARKIALGASYQLNKAVRLSAGYRWGENKTESQQIALRDNFWWLGMSYQFSSPLLVNIGYYQDNVKQRNGIGNQPTMRQMTAQAIYSLSKRTDVYGAVSHARNAGLGFAALSTLASGANSQSGVSIGVRHRF